jgi:hypothetical protein
MVAELRVVFDRYSRNGLLETPIACQLFLGLLRNGMQPAQGAQKSQNI